MMTSNIPYEWVLGIVSESRFGRVDADENASDAGRYVHTV